MSHLLDASVLIASGWEHHENHEAANLWLDGTKAFATCPLVQMAFVRVSLSQSIAVTFQEAQDTLAEVVNDARHLFVVDDIKASRLPTVFGNKEVTDAHLVTLARRHGLKLATLDKPLCTKEWAAGIADYIG